MLAHWRIKNFKSFGNQPDIALSAINVLAGANSSGKSTIIQSILLLKQTLQYGSDNRSIALNGPLLRLGAFDDVLNQDCEDQTIEIGFKFLFSNRDFTTHPPSPWIRALSRARSGSEIGLKTVALDLKWQRTQEPELPFGNDLSSRQRRTPILVSTSLQTTRESAGGEEKTFTSFVRRDPKDAETDEMSFSGRDFVVELDDFSKQEISKDRPDASISGGHLSFFLPAWITIHFNETARHAIQIADALCTPRGTLLTEHTLTNEQVSRNVIDAIDRWLIERGRPPLATPNEHVPAIAARNALRDAIPNDPLSLLVFPTVSADNEEIASLAKLKAEIISRMIAEQPPDYEQELATPRINTEVSGFIKEFFKQGVRYLGPLRDSPRPVYQLEALESTTDVGYRGEHTAAVLDLNGFRRISYVKPPVTSRTPSPRDRQAARASLRDAVVEWLVYLGVASDVMTTDAGVFGHQLQVTTHDKGKLHDLTNVGVGVSQVLPIVVMALLAPRGSLLIFEQPELHLHPSVQARLADFFIALAQDDKQLVLETHSEYLIDRFRLRIAEAATDGVRSLINILFSEKRGSQSQLTPIEVNEYGAIANWPKDFFEQSQTDVSLIIRAAADKRRTRQPS